MKTEKKHLKLQGYPKIASLEAAKKSSNFRVVEAAEMIETHKNVLGRQDYSERYTRVHSQYERR